MILKEAGTAVHVLIVDDSEVFRTTLADTLADLLGARVIQAVDGEDALRRLDQTDDVDLVLVDYRMPGIDGLEVSRRILDRGQPPRVVMMTGFDEARYGARARELGVHGFFCKTDGIAALLEQIEQATA